LGTAGAKRPQYPISGLYTLYLERTTLE
jgi:hypothetical protein